MIIEKIINKSRLIEARIYFILLLGYFRARPIIFNFSFEDVKADYDYIKRKYFNDKETYKVNLSPATKTILVNKLLKYTGFSLYKNKTDKPLLIERLNDVVKINLEPRYVFDECIAYFGQQRIALAVNGKCSSIITTPFFRSNL